MTKANILKICKEQGLKADVNTVISKLNAGHIPYIVDVCSSLNVNVSFQPATEFIFGEYKKNPILPSLEQYRQAIDFLIEQKRKGCSLIVNSLPSLNYLRYWPGRKKMRCAAGVLNCRIEPDGRLYACGGKPVIDPGYGIDLKKYSFDEAFRQIKRPPCDGCWCNIWIDFNLLASFNPFTFF